MSITAPEDERILVSNSSSPMMFIAHDLIYCSETQAIPQSDSAAPQIQMLITIGVYGDAHNCRFGRCS